jgi:glycosyltransferase involved in cell wall biosynthesis
MTPPTRTKVLFLITKSNWGGAQRYVYDLATTLDQTLYEPVVVLGERVMTSDTTPLVAGVMIDDRPKQKQVKQGGELTQKLAAAGIRTISLKTLQRDFSLTKELRFARELWQILRHERPTILHVNSSKAGGVGCFVGQLALVPRVIFTAHGWAFNENRSRVQKTIIKTLHWLTVLLSHKTIAVSRAIVTQMNWPLVAKKMIVINPGRTIPEFESRLTARTTIINVYPPLATHVADVWLFILGELHPVKQHKRLFRAMQSIIVDYPHVRLVCIGQGELQEDLQDYIEKNDLTEHVFLIGHIHEAATTLKAADLFVLPSLSESYGYVLHEAGLAQVPIIASSVGGIVDIISDPTEGTLVDPRDQEGLTQAIRTFLQTPHLYNDRTQKLQIKLTDRTVQTMTDATVNLYNS